MYPIDAHRIKELERERAYLLERCLRLEAQKAMLLEHIGRDGASRLINQAIIQMREKKRLTFQAIADRLGLSHSTVIRRYRGAQR